MTSWPINEFEIFSAREGNMHDNRKFLVSISWTPGITLEPWGFKWEGDTTEFF